MSEAPALSLQQAVARELIRERTRLQPRVVARHARTALVLRRLAERLDPAPEPQPQPQPFR